MEKIKNILIFIVCVAVILGVIGLLMAWSDGYLEGTALESVLRVLFPAFIVAWVLYLIFSYWLDRINRGVSVIGFLLFLILAVVFILLPLPDIAYLVAIIVLGIAALITGAARLFGL